jgi:hypothetical protein
MQKGRVVSEFQISRRHALIQFASFLTNGSSFWNHNETFRLIIRNDSLFAHDMQNNKQQERLL